MRLTAFNWVGGSLQGHRSAVRLVDVHSENQPHPCVLASNVCFPFAQFNVGITELQDACTVDSKRETEE